MWPFFSPRTSGLRLFGHDPWVLNAQGKARYLGSFNDPVSAARRYDEVAARVRGKNAALNFPAGSNPSQSPKRAHRQAASPLVNGGDGGKLLVDRAAARPAGIVRRKSPPVTGTLKPNKYARKVNSTSWGVKGQDG
jgi:hypothetical protein